MPSPFPGMNPYLEQAILWDDFHMSFVVGLRTSLASVVPPGFTVRIAEHVFTHERYENEWPSAHAPHVLYGSNPTRPVDRVVAPATVVLGRVCGQFRQPYLELRPPREWHPACVIDVLSPFLKRTGPDRDQHWYRVRCGLAQMAGYVELDLLRGGLRMPWQNLPSADYSVVVSRYSDRPRVEAWAVGLRDRLPVIPIPLRPEEPDLSVDLQAVFDRVYDEAGYAGFGHHKGLIPPLPPADAAWAESLLPAGGRPG